MSNFDFIVLGSGPGGYVKPQSKSPSIWDFKNCHYRKRKSWWRFGLNWGVSLRKAYEIRSGFSKYFYMQADYGLKG